MGGIERALDISGKLEVNAHSIAAAGVTLYRQEVEGEKKAFEAEHEATSKELTDVREALKKSLKTRATDILNGPLDKAMDAYGSVAKLGVFCNPRYDLHFFINDGKEAKECRVLVTITTSSGKLEDHYPMLYEKSELAMIKKINDLEEQLRDIDNSITGCELKLCPSSIDAMKDTIEGGITMENLKHLSGGERIQDMIEAIVRAQRKSDGSKCLPAPKKKR